MGGEYAGRKDMMVYIALCDARWNIRKVIRSIEEVADLNTSKLC